MVTAKIPSLNERPDDIIPLAKHFLHEFNLKFNKKLKGISVQAQALLEAHEFTGNVRELKNIIERSVLVARNQLICVAEMGLLANDTPGHPDASQKEIVTPRLPEEGVHLNDLLSGIEREYMALAMKRARGNESAAAKLLNMNHHTFRYRWKKISKN